MATLDDDDRKEIAKLVSDGVSALASKRESKMLEAITAKMEEAMTERMTAAEKAKERAASTPNPEAEERKTLTQRVKMLEGERDKAMADARQERTNTAFRKSWGGAKFVPELADEHMAFLGSAGRLLHEDDGTIRVRDPKKAKEETQPTLDEYMGELAKSDRGKLYMPAPKTAGGGATSPNNGTPQKREFIPNAIAGLMSGNLGE